MASKSAPLTRLFLIALSAISVSRAQSPQAFQRKHVTFLDHIDHNRCNSEMRNKRIAQTTSGCKRLNTFIHAPKELDQACVAGKPYVIQNLEYKKSPQKFRVTNCRLSQDHGNDCEYMAEASSWRYIVVSCDQNNRPVHLARTLSDTTAGKQDEKQPSWNPTPKPPGSASAANFSHWFLGQGSLRTGCFGAGLLVFYLLLFSCL
ncbi:ribonuclease pancreatic-like [Rhineura floridana]|uniref:ribonuclease pancreatic-like n=1 Tax=Rhineura floridana TaxID=261503 RepID=UPI002AC882FD|nr:ribonuclease pancreatic-like [Rhineura floridana]